MCASPHYSILHHVWYTRKQQVHKAVLKDGTDVVVKVQHPGKRATFIHIHIHIHTYMCVNVYMIGTYVRLIFVRICCV